MVILGRVEKLLDFFVRDLKESASHKGQIVLFEIRFSEIHVAASLALEWGYPTLQVRWLVAIVMGTNLQHFKGNLTHFFVK